MVHTRIIYSFWSAWTLQLACCSLPRPWTCCRYRNRYHNVTHGRPHHRCRYWERVGCGSTAMALCCVSSWRRGLFQINRGQAPILATSFRLTRRWCSITRIHAALSLAAGFAGAFWFRVIRPVAETTVVVDTSTTGEKEARSAQPGTVSCPPSWGIPSRVGQRALGHAHHPAVGGVQPQANELFPISTSSVRYRGKKFFKILYHRSNVLQIQQVACWCGSRLPLQAANFASPQNHLARGIRNRGSIQKACKSPHGHFRLKDEVLNEEKAHSVGISCLSFSPRCSRDDSSTSIPRKQALL
mmetsp:Transcript_13372/g.31357  ORF Transcript_13372/g.31357 Transcript_13372/m.31357 type:complete len:299 (+) Transcript_13372:120-1016(+)